MQGFKVRVVISELIGDSFKSIIDYDESCKIEDIRDTLDRLTNSVNRYLNVNNINGEENEEKREID